VKDIFKAFGFRKSIVCDMIKTWLDRDNAS
jgi:hypothetical protein